MGRTRGFDERQVVIDAARLFTRRGYEATSVDDLVAATGLHRGSLYQAFGSKRGIFVRVLRLLVDRDLPRAPAGPSAEDEVDLLLVAAMDLAPRDAEVRALVAAGCARLAGARAGAAPDASVQPPSAVLGARLLARAGVAPPALPSDSRGTPR